MIQEPVRCTTEVFTSERYKSPLLPHSPSHGGGLRVHAATQSRLGGGRGAAGLPGPQFPVCFKQCKRTLCRFASLSQWLALTPEDPIFDQAGFEPPLPPSRPPHPVGYSPTGSLAHSAPSPRSAPGGLLANGLLAHWVRESNPQKKLRPAFLLTSAAP